MRKVQKLEERIRVGSNLVMNDRARREHCAWMNRGRRCEVRQKQCGGERRGHPKSGKFDNWSLRG